MWEHLQIELYKVFKRPRTYLSFAAITALIGVIQLGLWVDGKEYADFVQKYNLKDEEVIYMGDDIPDYEVMKICGVPCCPADAAPEIKTIARYISHVNGGQGCGRDVIEQVLKAKDK